MNEAGNAKQQIVERIKKSTNILVTVSTSPSVDELSAALGLTLLLNKLDKHATAVVSGDIPPAITFLDPEKTFEDTVDSLRDFIIALDKEKADHLRYKVEGDVVKIFITPYRTTIGSDDLEFSQGDYNVELVLALGVKSKEHLDTALSAHGKILHDATVATLTAGSATSELGSIDWHDENASSLSEMLVSLSEALKGDKPLLDDQTSTAFLTGIVAATDRFSNNKTSSRVMTMAAQLMAAGANQQLIAAKLEEAHEIGVEEPAAPDGTTELSEDTSAKLDKKATEPEVTQKPDDGSLQVSHDLDESLEKASAAVVTERQEQAAKEAEEQLAEQLKTTVPMAPSVPTPDQIEQDLKPNAVETPAEPEPLHGAVHASAWQGEPQAEPTLGGTLNATTEQAADDMRREEEDDRNRTILSHGGPSAYVMSGEPTYGSPINSAVTEDHEPTIDPFAEKPQQDEPGAPSTVLKQPQVIPSGQTLADLDAQNRATPASEDHARAAVEAALEAAPTTENPFTVDNPALLGQANPSGVYAAPLPPPPPPMPDFSTLPPLPPPPTFTPPTVQPEPEAPGNIFTPELTPPVPPAPANDPGQFHIPGQ